MINELQISHDYPVSENLIPNFDVWLTYPQCRSVHAVPDKKPRGEDE